MRSVTYYFQKGRNQPLIIHPFGDVHMGSIGCNAKLIHEFVDLIRSDKNRYFVLMGDLIEAINISDTRFDERQVSPRYHSIYSNLAGEQADDIIKLLKPIQNKCLGAIWGNHEETIRLHYHNDIHGYICNQLRVPNLTADCFLNLHFHRNPISKGNHRVITIFLAHKVNSGMTIGAATNATERMARGFQADIYLSGHHHKQFALSDNMCLVRRDSHTPQIKKDKGGRLLMRTGDITYRKRLYAGTGSFFGTYPCTYNDRDIKTTYGERSLFSPNSLGTIEIQIVPFHRLSYKPDTTEAIYTVTV
jgi:UDP-2,3-diacylglucosamine pyrophosphatase LpxH